MISFRMLLCALALMLLAADVDSSFSGSSGDDSNNLTVEELRTLYNSPVFMAELMTRPWISLIEHSGVRVTLADGAQWLVHKGLKYGKSATVVTDAVHMSSRWKVVKTVNFGGRKTVSDFVADGGPNYIPLLDDCNSASGRMMEP